MPALCKLLREATVLTEAIQVLHLAAFPANSNLVCLGSGPVLAGNSYSVSVTALDVFDNPTSILSSLISCSVTNPNGNVSTTVFNPPVTSGTLSCQTLSFMVAGQSSISCSMENTPLSGACPVTVIAPAPAVNSQLVTSVVSVVAGTPFDATVLTRDQFNNPVLNAASNVVRL